MLVSLYYWIQKRFHLVNNENECSIFARKVQVCNEKICTCIYIYMYIYWTFLHMFVNIQEECKFFQPNCWKDEKVNKSILLIFSEITLSTQRTLSIVYCTKETEFPAWRGKCIASLSVPKRSSMSKKAHRPGFTSSKILFRCIRD